MLGTVIAATAVLVGATMQRITGLGFTLVSGSFLVLALGPFNGVVLANILSLVASGIVLAVTWRAARWKTAMLLTIGVAAAVFPGAWLAAALPEAILSITVGSLAVIAVGVVIFGRPMPGLARLTGTLGTGIASGFSNVTAGIGGPPLAVYGASAAMKHGEFVATVQVVVVLMNALSLAAKHSFDIPLRILLICLTTTLVGVVVGNVLARHIKPRRARSLVLVLALAGGAAAVIKGLATL